MKKTAILAAVVSATLSYASATPIPISDSAYAERLNGIHQSVGAQIRLAASPQTDPAMLDKIAQQLPRQSLIASVTELDAPGARALLMGKGFKEYPLRFGILYVLYYPDKSAGPGKGAAQEVTLYTNRRDIKIRFRSFAVLGGLRHLQDIQLFTGGRVTNSGVQVITPQAL